MVTQTHHEVVVRATAESGLFRMVAVMAVAMPLAGLIQVLASAGQYRQPAVAVAVWLAVAASGAWLVPRSHARRLTPAQAAAAQLIAVAAVAAIGWDRRVYHAGAHVDLAILGTAWLLALAALSRPPRAWVPGVLAVFAVHTVLLLRASGANPLSLAQLEAAGYILAIVVIAFAAVRPTLTTLTTMTARRAELASRSVAERAAASAVLAERRDRLALLELEALPLLRGIAGGTLDPTAAEVRERCAYHAAVLRHSLTGRPQRLPGTQAPPGTPATGGLVAGLEPALRAAAARGLLVDVQLIGDPGTPAPPVVHAALAAVDAVIGVLPPHQVTLTVLASGDDVEVYVTFTEPPRTVPDLARLARDVPAAAGWHATLDAGCLEIGWRR